MLELEPLHDTGVFEALLDNGYCTMLYHCCPCILSLYNHALQPCQRAHGYPSTKGIYMLNSDFLTNRHRVGTRAIFKITAYSDMISSWIRGLHLSCILIRRKFIRTKKARHQANHLYWKMYIFQTQHPDLEAIGACVKYHVWAVSLYIHEDVPGLRVINSIPFWIEPQWLMISDWLAINSRPPQGSNKSNTKCWTYRMSDGLLQKSIGLSLDWQDSLVMLLSNYETEKYRSV